MPVRADQAMFVNLVEAHQAAVYNLCYRMLGSETEAEDAAQETFLRAYDQFGRYDPARPFKTWLLSIAHHYCIDRLRRGRWVALDIDDETLAESIACQRADADPEGLAIRGEQQRAVQALLARLAPDDRACIIMRYWYGLSYVEIAAATRSSLPAVKSRLHRARCTMAGYMAPPAATVPARRPGKVSAARAGLALRAS